MKNLFWLIVLLFTSCTNSDTLESALKYAGENRTELESALKFAGENRSELESVLEHYSQNPNDSLKLLSAMYLIENMPWQYSITDNMTSGYFQKVEEIYPHLNFARRMALFSMPQFYMSGKKNAEYDIHYITSEFLIRHIDYLFDISGDRLANGELSFDIFSKYLLPYRISNEPLDYYKGNYRFEAEQFDEYRQFDLKYKDWIFGLLVMYSTSIRDTIRKFDLPFPVDNEVRSTECINTAFYGKKMNDLLGIPSAIYFTPHFHNRNDRHYWTYQITNIEDVKKGAQLAYDAPKVYRISYEKYNNPINYGREFVPLDFVFLNLEDVTKYACEVADVQLGFKGLKNNPRYLYLAVFNDMQWRPVAWAEKKGRHAIFTDMAKGVLYRAVYYDKERMRLAGYPFFLTNDGKINTFKKDKSTVEKIRINRKYPYNGNKVHRILSLQEMSIIASMDGDFQRADTLAKLEYKHGLPYYEVNNARNEPFKYLRLAGKNPQYYNNISEIFFYDDKHNKIPANPVNSDFSKLFDNNLLSVQPIREIIDIEFAEPICPSYLEIYPQTDENDIYPGDRYELFYADISGWKSLGVKVANDHFLEYDNVPSGTLLWLHNHTKGREERPFIYKNDKITFF